MFDPRLSQILTILLQQQDAVSLTFLAEQCKTSKRTIYRELADIDRTLKKYGLTLNSKAKRGIALDGSDDGRRRLRKELENSERFNPRDRDERQKKLITELLKQDQPQKIYYYSELLQVSETTIGNDLETLEEWFAKGKIQLIRKSGVGISLKYEEIDYRKTLYHFLMDQLKESTPYQVQNDRDPAIAELLERETWRKVLEVVETPPVAEEITRMTESSLMGFVCYIAIAIKRISNQKPLYMQYTDIENAKEDIRYTFVKKLMKQMETCFKSSVSQDEIVNIYHYYRGSKLQTVDSMINEESAELEEQKAMAFEMCDAFDAKIAFELKQDEELIAGLVAHLQPTFTRLQHEFAIQNPLLTDIKTIYPDIYEKSWNAARVLERKFGYTIPEDEVGFLALHFGGAIVRIKNKRQSYRRILVGVVCASGIGISSLLSAKLRQLYGNQVQIKIFSKRELERDTKLAVDLLVTTFDLMDLSIPVVKVHPILTAENVKKLSEMLESIVGGNGVEEVKGIWEEEFDETVMIVNEMNHIIKHFQVYSVNHDMQFDDIVRYASQVIVDQAEDMEKVYNALWAREQLSSQVIPEFEIALLHTKTEVVEYSKITVLIPTEGCFRNSYMKAVRAAILILIPESDQRQVLAVSSISGALFEDEAFLELMLTGDREKILNSIKRALNRFFEDYMHRRYS